MVDVWLMLHNIFPLLFIDHPATPQRRFQVVTKQLNTSCMSLGLAQPISGLFSHEHTGKTFANWFVQCTLLFKDLFLLPRFRRFKLTSFSLLRSMRPFTTSDGWIDFIFVYPASTPWHMLLQELHTLVLEHTQLNLLWSEQLEILAKRLGNLQTPSQMGSTTVSDQCIKKHVSWTWFYCQHKSSLGCWGSWKWICHSPSMQ